MAGRLKKLIQWLKPLDWPVLKKYWFWLDLFSLIPAVAMALTAIFMLLPDFLQNTLGMVVVLPIMASVLLRCFFIPHIPATLLVIASIVSFLRDKRSGQLRKKDLLVFLLFILLCLVGLFCIEYIFQGAMSV